MASNAAANRGAYASAGKSRRRNRSAPKEREPRDRTVITPEFVRVLSVGVALAMLMLGLFLVIDGDVDRVETSLNARMDRVEDRIDRLELRVGQVEARVSQLEVRMERLETRMDHLETSMGRLETRMDSMEERMGRIERQQAQIIGLLEGLRNDMSGQSRLP